MTFPIASMVKVQVLRFPGTDAYKMFKSSVAKGRLIFRFSLGNGTAGLHVLKSADCSELEP